MKMQKEFTHYHGVVHKTKTEKVINIIAQNLYKTFYDEVGKTIEPGTQFKIHFNIEFYIPDKVIKFYDKKKHTKTTSK